MIDDLKAIQKWKKIDKQNQRLLLKNVFCADCGVTTIVGYNLLDDQYGVVLKGKCKKCGKGVVRYVEI
jgi:ribosomal protein S27AE